MVRKVLILMAVVLFLSAGEVQAATAVSWDGGGDGRSWEDGNNWNPNIVPNGDFDVTIDGGSGTNIWFQHNHTINRLTCYGKVQLGCWPLEAIALTIMDDVNGLINHDTLNMDDTFVINGNISNYHELIIEENGEVHGNIVNHGFMEATGDVAIEGSVTNIAGAKALLGDEDSGTSIEGNLNNANGGVIEVESSLNVGGDLDNAGCVGLRTFFKCKIDGELINSGVLYNDVLIPVRIELEADANNSGTIEVNTGGGIAFDCNLVNEPNAIIKLLGGTLAAKTITQSADANFAGFGGITGNVQIDPNAIIKLTGPTNIIGDVNIPTGATLEISDGQTLITGHTTCDGTIHLIGGTVIFQGGCDCDGCNIINEAGTDRNHFDINADGIEDFKDFASFANTWLWHASWY